MNDLTKRVKKIVSNISFFALFAGGVELRPYQLEAANAVAQSVFSNDGESYVFIFSRQSGKDETLAHLEAYIMTVLSHRDKTIIMANPTYKPQTINSMMRLDGRMAKNVLTRGRYKPQAGYMYRLGFARCMFFSADPSANVVGATASALLILNEAQDIPSAVYDKRFAPMAAANNAVRLFSGTSWTSDTLLARELRAAREKEKQDGKKRVFLVDCEEVAKVAPAYGEFVRGEVARLGRNHPMIRTQYYCEEIDAQAGMFNAMRRALMQGDVEPESAPLPNSTYAFCIDVAGQDEAVNDLDGFSNPGRDSTTLSIVRLDLSSVETIKYPTYRVVVRMSWQGLNHLSLFSTLSNLIEFWRPQNILIDASGVGEGLWAMLDRAFPTRVTPVKFSQQVKSEIGWRFLGIVETGRFRDCAPNDICRVQYDKCQSEIVPGVAKTLRWGVPDGTRDSEGNLVHDDFILADSLVAKLDELDWSLSAPTEIIRAVDPLEEMSRL